LVKEKRNFLIGLLITNPPGEKYGSVDLSKRLDIEIDWQTGGKGKSANSKGDIVIFEKEGERYRVIVKINQIKKGWFKDEVVDYTFEPLPGQKFIVSESKFSKTGWFGMFKTDYSPNNIKSTQRRWSGFILISVLVITIIAVIIFFWRWKQKKKRG